MGNSQKRKGNRKGSIVFDDVRGNWRGAVMVNGARRWARGRTQTDVQRALDKFVSATLDPKPEEDLEGIPETVERFLWRWLDTISPVREPKTLEVYSDQVRLHIVPAIGHIELQKLKRDDVQRLLINPMIPKFSRRTIEQARDVLRNALAYALDIEEIVGSNAARKVELPATQDKEIEPYSPDEVHQLLRALEGHRYEALFTLSILSGMRKGEVLALNWSDINFKERRITVSKSLSKPRGGDWRFGDTKTHRVRTVDMASDLVDALVKHREAQELERIWNAPHFNNQFNLVFTTELGTPIDGHNLSREWRKIVENTGLPYKSIHKLRHGTASLVQQAGGTLLDASKILGHSGIGITARLYSHLFPENRRTLMDGVAKAAAPDR